MNDGSTPQSPNEVLVEDKCLGQYRHAYSWIWDAKGEMTNQQRCVNCGKIKTPDRLKDEGQQHEQ